MLPRVKVRTNGWPRRSGQKLAVTRERLQKQLPEDKGNLKIKKEGNLQLKWGGPQPRAGEKSRGRGWKPREISRTKGRDGEMSP